MLVPDVSSNSVLPTPTLTVVFALGTKQTYPLSFLPSTDGTPRPFNMHSSPGCVPAETLTSTSPSRVGTLALPPSMPVCNGIRTCCSRFDPCRWNIREGPTLTRTNKSPALPDPRRGLSPAPATTNYHSVLDTCSHPVGQDRCYIQLAIEIETHLLARSHQPTLVSSPFLHHRSHHTASPWVCKTLILGM